MRERDRTILVFVAVLAVALLILSVVLGQAGCASSPEQREARRAAAVETAKRLAACAVDGGLACAPETAALVGCAVSAGLHCEAERMAWARCLQARAIGCGVAAVGGLISGAAADGPDVGDGCALGAAEVCADVAGDAAGVEVCLGASLVPCVD